MEVRAVGYTPVQHVVQLAAGEPASLEVRLTERAVALPGVEVRAAAAQTVRMTRFYERMRDAEKGINRGFFITPEELERRKPALITQMFQGVPGLTVQYGAGGGSGPRDKVVFGPLKMGPVSRCVMTIYMDGIRVFPTLGAGAPGRRPDETIDALVNPTDVLAMEAYPYPVDVPPQYQSLNGTCGVILIWTK